MTIGLFRGHFSLGLIDYGVYGMGSSWPGLEISTVEPDTSVQLHYKVVKSCQHFLLVQLAWNIALRTQAF